MGVHVYLSFEKNETATMFFLVLYAKQTNNLPPYLNSKVP